MVIVNLVDGTSYLIDTDDNSTARDVVEHKLKDRHDFRKIAGTIVLKDCLLDKNSKYYNSDDYYDNRELQCKTGWSYKWD